MKTGPQGIDQVGRGCGLGSYRSTGAEDILKRLNSMTGLGSKQSREKDERIQNKGCYNLNVSPKGSDVGILVPNVAMLR